MQDKDDGIAVTIWVDLYVLPHPILRSDFTIYEDFRFSLKIGDFQYTACILECKPPLKVKQRGLVKIVFITLRDHMQFYEVGRRVKVLGGTQYFISEGTIEEIVSVTSWDAPI